MVEVLEELTARELLPNEAAAVMQLAGRQPYGCQAVSVILGCVRCQALCHHVVHACKPAGMPPHGAALCKKALTVHVLHGASCRRLPRCR